MNPTEREQVRLSLLRYMASNRSGYGLPARALRQYLHAEGTSEKVAMGWFLNWNQRQRLYLVICHQNEVPT